MGYHPNEEAVLWFAAEAWPLLRRDRPNLRFQVVGTGPGERMRALATQGHGIEVLGRVPNMTDYLGRATVAIAPMRSGSGIQNKVLEALSMGTPVVASSIANRGVRGIPEHDLLVADDPATFASAILRLLDEPGSRARLARSGRTFVEQNYRWEQHGARLTEIYEGVGSQESVPIPDS
jgi:glycosyltransferase involved in cell wall biosynthesis